MEFYEVEPTLENYWRAIILFGKNSASYKFALAKSLYDLHTVPNDLVTMDQLAVPFSRHLCEHLQHSPKQITSKSSPVIRACNSFNNNELSQDELIKETVKNAFNDVIDRFHTVNSGSIPKQFYIDERVGKNKGGIRITEDFFRLAESKQFKSFENETEARWRLVEEAWKMNVSRNLIRVEYDQDLKTLFTSGKERRINITSCRDSLNGYQKGRCFYCYSPISVNTGETNLADVDHFIPWSLNYLLPNLNGVWNLVLSCIDCNRGNKSAKIPSIRLLERLHKRNEYFINSHLPLRETLIQQTGNNEITRHRFLQDIRSTARLEKIQVWEPEVQGIITF